MSNNNHNREGSLSPRSKSMMSCDWDDAPAAPATSRSNLSSASASASRHPGSNREVVSSTMTTNPIGPICNYTVVTSPGGTKRESFTLNGDLRSCAITFGDGKVVVKPSADPN